MEYRAPGVEKSGSQTGGSGDQKGWRTTRGARDSMGTLCAVNADPATLADDGRSSSSTRTIALLSTRDYFGLAVMTRPALRAAASHASRSALRRLLARVMALRYSAALVRARTKSRMLGLEAASWAQAASMIARRSGGVEGGSISKFGRRGSLAHVMRATSPSGSTSSTSSYGVAPVRISHTVTAKE